MNRPTLFQSIITICMIVQLFTGTSALAGSVAESILQSRHLLANKGNVDAQFKLGSMYELGIGTDKDLAMASNFYTQASKQGYASAEDRLRYLDMRKNGFNQKNDGDWLVKIKNDADKGDSEAVMLLGQMHSYGLGVKKDLNESMRMFNKADLDNPVILFEIDRVDKERKQLAKLELEHERQKEAEMVNNKIINAQDKVLAEAMKKEAEVKRIADKKRRYEEYKHKLAAEQKILNDQQAWAEAK